MAVDHLEKWAIANRHELQVGGEVVLFFKEQMEKVTRRYIAIIRPILKETKG